jgi:hypothetical protein
MQQRPPNSPGTVDLIHGEITRLNQSYNLRFGEQVHHHFSTDDKARQRLSVGPLEEDWDELTELAKDLYSWLVEGFSIAALRRPLSAESYSKDWKQIKLIETLMSEVLGGEQADVAALVGPLKDLNGLRVGHAHSLDVPQLRHFDIAGRRVRDAWFLVVDGLVVGLRGLSDLLNADQDATPPPASTTIP